MKKSALDKHFERTIITMGGYRDSAIVTSPPEKYLKELSETVNFKNKHAKEIALNGKIDKIANKLHNKILPEIAAKGKNSYTFKFSFWFKLFNRGRINEAYSMLKTKMQELRYVNVGMNYDHYPTTFFPSYTESLSFQW